MFVWIIYLPELIARKIIHKCLFLLNNLRMKGLEIKIVLHTIIVCAIDVNFLILVLGFIQYLDDTIPFPRSIDSSRPLLPLWITARSNSNFHDFNRYFDHYLLYFKYKIRVRLWIFVLYFERNNMHKQILLQRRKC